MPERTEADASAGIFRSAGIVSAAVMLSRLTGLVREVILARWFGASAPFDAFRMGFRIPSLARELFAEGALSSAFVPTFTEYLTKNGKEAAGRLLNLVGTAAFLVVGGLCVLGITFAPQLVGLLVPGFALVPGKMELAVHLTRIMFPFLLMTALAAQVMGVLNASNQFAIPALASTVFNVTSIGIGMVLGFQFGPALGIDPIVGMAWGVLMGGVLQLLWQIPALLRLGYRPSFDLDWSHPGLRRVIRLMGPAILGSAAVQVNVTVNSNLASFIEDPVRGFNGPVSWLEWAYRFIQLPIGMFGAALASATLPAISRSAATGNLDEFRSTFARSLGMVLLMTLPSAIGLVVLADHIVATVYQRGEFNAYDTQQTALAMTYYAIGMAGYAGTKLLSPAFYALGDSRTPMKVSCLAIGVNFLVAWTAVRHTSLGHAGLALAVSVVSLCNFVLLFLLLRKRIGGVHGRALFSSVVKIVAAALAMGAVVTVADQLLERWLGTGKGPSVVTLLVSIPLGLGAFYFAGRALQVRELDAALRAFSGPLKRLTGRRG